MTYTKYFISITVFLILTVNSFCTAQTVKLLCERHRTEWNWIEYRISLENTSAIPILNPEIHYYAADKDQSVAVDYVSYLYSVNSTVTPASDLSDIKFNVLGLLFPNNKIDINFRLYKKDWSAHSFTKDWSYQKNENVAEPNYFMTVYDAAHNILWGSDPLNGNSNTGDVITWIDRGVNSTVYRYDGNTNEYIPAGRFWLFKDTPLSPKERDLLAQRGVSKLSIGRSRGKIVAVFKSNSNIQKKAIDSLIAGFYNAIPVADTVPVAIDLTDEDLYTEKDVCNAGQCHKEVELRSEFGMDISCWDDVDVNNCVSAIRNCGGQDIGVARGFIVATIAKDSLQCLSKNRDIETLNVQRKMQQLMPTGRAGININELQDSDVWKNALAKDSAYLDWLKDAEYTGEGIVVGVYEEHPFYFGHPTFNEYDSKGDAHARKIRKEEFFGVGDFNDKMEKMIFSISRPKHSLFDNHGTVVTGAIGGNGNNSPNFEYRGVAPKVHFYINTHVTLKNSGNIVKTNTNTNQIGHVVNHSHTTTTAPLYGQDDYNFDKALFFNWKSTCSQASYTPCVEGDTLTKTVVFAAGNNGNFTPQEGYGYNRSYHSILAPAKNPITVGMISAVEKIRAHESSMGPTWDGRIKPDVMAPGFSSITKVDNSNPFDVSINYIKLFRKNESTPYINIDFSSGSHTPDPSNTIESGSCQVNAELHCTINHIPSKDHPPLLEWYVTWNLPSNTVIFPTDSIEIRYRIAQFSNDTLYGAARLGEKEIFLQWLVSGKYETVRKSTASLYDSIEANSLRIDFDFSKGFTLPDNCHNEICEYITFSNGGTSNAAPFVSGIAALMYQKFKKQTGDPLDKHSMRNSTVKALLIHTAKDMEDSEEAHIACNADLTITHNDGKCHFTPYGKGPDFATGWGFVDGKAALDLISDYNKKTKEFPKFKEIEIGNSFEKRWIINIDTAQSRLRTTLVWDDAPGHTDKSDNFYREMTNKESKLVNDIDLFLISPSGKYYYPWRLNPLPTDYLDSLGNPTTITKGYESIHDSDAVKGAYNDCTSLNKLDYDCVDHLNNVEVVDVENPELGKWQVVVFGRSITEFNNASDNAQVASLVSDLDLKPDNKLGSTYSCAVINGYDPQTDYSCTQPLGNNMIYYVTFHDSTSLGDGDDIVLTDANGNTIGMYVGNELAGKTVKVKSSKLTVTLHSDNDKSQGWGFKITRIRSVNQAILKMPFEAIKKKRRTP